MGTYALLQGFPGSTCDVVEPHGGSVGISGVSFLSYPVHVEGSLYLGTSLKHLFHGPNLPLEA